MMKSFIAFIACVAAAPASAAVMQATYTGVVTYSVNRTGEFGVSGVEGLLGLSAMTTFVYDTDIGIISQIDGGLTLSGELLPINLPPAPPPLLSASITINGVTRAVNPLSSGSVLLQKIGATTTVSHNASNLTFGPNSQYNYILGLLFTEDIFPIESFTDELFLTGIGVTAVEQSGAFSFIRTINGVDVEYVDGAVAYDTVTISRLVDGPIPAPIPVPAAGLMMMTALGALAAVRRRALSNRING